MTSAGSTPQSLSSYVIHLMRLNTMVGLFRAREVPVFRTPRALPWAFLSLPLRGEIQEVRLLKPNVKFRRWYILIISKYRY
jgi:hypothetical protein